MSSASGHGSDNEGLLIAWRTPLKLSAPHAISIRSAVRIMRSCFTRLLSGNECKERDLSRVRLKALACLLFVLAGGLAVLLFLRFCAVVPLGESWCRL